MERWHEYGNFMCKTYNGASVVDYVICSQSLIKNITNVFVDNPMHDLKSDHKSICIVISWGSQNQYTIKMHPHQQSPTKGRILIT